MHQQNEKGVDYECTRGAMPTLALALVVRDAGLQPRAQLNAEVVQEYQEVLRRWNKKEPCPLPPLDIVYDGKKHYLTDGYHRAEALELEGLTEVAVTIIPGSYRDAILASCKANATHGLRRTNEDKHRQVMRMLKDKEWVEWSNPDIAKHCSVSHEFVRKIRISLQSSLSTVDSDPIKPQQKQSSSDTRKYVNKHGSVSTMKTVNIGKAQAPSTKEPNFALSKQVHQFLATNHPATPQQVFSWLVQQGLIARNNENLAAVTDCMRRMLDRGDIEAEWIDEAPPTEQKRSRALASSSTWEGEAFQQERLIGEVRGLYPSRVKAQTMTDPHKRKWSVIFRSYPGLVSGELFLHVRREGVVFHIEHVNQDSPQEAPERVVFSLARLRDSELNEQRGVKHRYRSLMKESATDSGCHARAALPLHVFGHASMK